MRAHIRTVVGRYKGRIHGWDVVNEAIDEDGSMRKSPWQVGIGDDYVASAFEFAHEADSDAELYYNDFNLEKPAKRAGVIKPFRTSRRTSCVSTASATRRTGASRRQPSTRSTTHSWSCMPPD
jgi:endo-1,4-beta-xylanase